MNTKNWGKKFLIAEKVESFKISAEDRLDLVRQPSGSKNSLWLTEGSALQSNFLLPGIPVIFNARSEGLSSRGSLFALRGLF